MNHAEPNGWHGSERVFIQARSGNQFLANYTQRHLLAGRRFVKTEVTAATKRDPVYPWDWVPVEDVIWDWEIRKLA